MNRRVMMLSWLVPLLAAGCGDSQQASVGWLPDPELDLMYRASQPKRPAAPPQVAEWAVSGSRPWKYVVIHHSATDNGSAESFDKAHRARGWDELGYHFVIDNGNGGPDGRVEVGGRWKSQKWGAHTGGTPDNEYNNHGIGVCLVGNFTGELPSAAQQASLRRLVEYLMRTYDIPPSRVIGHRDAPGAKTECPGDKLYSYVHASLRSDLARQLAASR